MPREESHLSLSAPKKPYETSLCDFVSLDNLEILNPWGDQS